MPAMKTIPRYPLQGILQARTEAGCEVVQVDVDPLGRMVKQGPKGDASVPLYDPADLEALDAYRGARRARQMGPRVYVLYG
jgi:hypothetical protein